MRKIKICVIIFLVAASIGCGYTILKKQNEEISLPYQNKILLQQTADLNKDGFEETIYLYGKPEDDVHYERLNLILKTTASGLLKKTNAEQLNGTSPAIHIADYTGDGIQEVMVRAEQGDTACIGIFDFSSSIPLNIFPDDAYIKMDLAFTDGFALEATMSESVFSISLEEIKNTLIEQGVYDAEGKRISNPSVSLLGYTDVVCTDHVFGVQPVVYGTQKTPLCYILPTLSYHQNVWQITDWQISFTPPLLP